MNPLFGHCKEKERIVQIFIDGKEQKVQKGATQTAEEEQMSFEIIGKLGGEEKAIAILKAAGIPASSDSIRMWKGRGMPPRAELAFTKEAIENSIAYEPNDFIHQPEE